MPTALITGASSGIGLELASSAARDRHDLVLVARQRERLESVGRGLAEEYGVRVSVLAKDLTEPAAPSAGEAIRPATRDPSAEVELRRGDSLP